MKKLSLLLVLSSFALAPVAVAQTAYPVFKVDLSFNKQMPHGYFLGQVAGITEDSHGNIWVIHRPRRVVPQLDEPPKEASGVPAPSVVEYDSKGNFVRAWGGPFAMSKDELAKFSGRSPSTASPSTARTMSGFAAMAATRRPARTTINA